MLCHIHLHIFLGEAQRDQNGFQQQYDKLKQDLMKMGYDLKQIDDAVISTQSARIAELQNIVGQGKKYMIKYYKSTAIIFSSASD